MYNRARADILTLPLELFIKGATFTRNDFNSRTSFLPNITLNNLSPDELPEKQGNLEIKVCKLKMDT